MERKKIKILTEKQFSCLNDYVTEFIKNKKGKGLVNIFVAHTTCAIKILEGEILLLSDIGSHLEKTFPKEGNYHHDKIDIRDVPATERVNGFAHMRQLFFSSDVTIPVEDGKTLLGKWQNVYLVEFDPVRERDVIITYFGE